GGRRVSCKRSRCIRGGGFAAGEDGQRFRMKDGLASVQHGIGKDGDVMRGGKYAGVWRYTSQHTGVLVIDFSLNDAVAEGAVIDCGRNRRTPCRGRIESCVCHTQRAEDLALAETVKRFISNALQRY